MSADNIIFWFYFLLIIISICAMTMFTVALFRINKILGYFQNVAEEFSSSLTKVIPAVINAVNVAEGIKRVLEIIAQSRKTKKTKEK